MTRIIEQNHHSLESDINESLSGIKADASCGKGSVACSCPQDNKGLDFLWASVPSEFYFSKLFVSLEITLWKFFYPQRFRIYQSFKKKSKTLRAYGITKNILTKK